MFPKPAYEELEKRIKALELSKSRLEETNAALRASEGRFRGLYESAPIGIFQTSADGQAMFVNSAMARMLGCASAQEAVAHYTDLARQLYVDPRRRDAFLERLLREGAVENFEYEARTYDGRTIWFSMNAWVSGRNDDGVHIIEGFATDITQRKHAGEALRASEKRFRDLLEMLPEAVFEADRNMKLTFASRQFYALFGYSALDIERGLSGFDLVAPEDRPKAQENAGKRFRGKELLIEEYRGQRKDGSTFPFLFRASPIKEEEAPVGIIGIIVDISKRKKIERQLQKAQRMESIGTLAGGIAHDFNNILSPIVGMAELLMEDLPGGGLEQKNARAILKAGLRGRELVKQILAFSRQSEHRMIPVRVQEILKEVLKLCRSTIPSNIEITSDIQSDCGSVEADPTQVHQVAMNLITNAFHATESTSGCISVRLAEATLGEDELGELSLGPGRYALLRVQDTGCGINPAVRDRIFEPYFTTKKKGKGTGLGLAMVYGIVKEHHGDIKVYSEVGRGTAVNVYLPLMETNAGEVPTERIATYQPGSEHILLIDDEPSIVQIEKLILERLGYRVTTHTSSPEALETFKANPEKFDLVLTDMTMPKMTGEMLAAELTAIRPGLPIILCTGFGERAGREKNEAPAIRGVITKPVTKSELSRMVRKALDGE